MHWLSTKNAQFAIVVLLPSFTVPFLPSNYEYSVLSYLDIKIRGLFVLMRV